MAAIKVNYSLPDLKISRVDRLPEISLPVYTGSGMEVAPGEFMMKVPGVADFYVYAAGAGVGDVGTQQNWKG